MPGPEPRPRVTAAAEISEPPERLKPQVPDHELIRRIGSGAYGEVWLAKNVVGTYRAVKVVYRASFKDERPYEREFRGIQKFEPISRSNDGFVDILQIGRNDEQGCFYYVMELADDAVPQVERQNELRVEASSVGTTASQLSTPNALNSYSPKTLRSEIQHRGRLPFEECLRFALSLNLALGHLHRQGLIHRDIKPSNIIFVGGVPKFADIGLVTDVEEARSFVGTEGFIPPEGPNSPQADIYSLGKVVYEMSMGKDRTEFPEPFTALGQATGSQELEELNAVILRACATNPRDRYQSAEDMHVDLALLQSGKSVKSKRLLERRLAFARKVGVAVGMAASIAVAGFLYQQFQTREARRLAQAETYQRTRAEGLLKAVQSKQAENEHLIDTLELKQAENFFENDNANKGVAYLAHLLLQKPTNQIVGSRLMSALTDRSFALPIRTFESGEDLHGAALNPNALQFVMCAGNGTQSVARIMDIQTGQIVGKPMRHSATVRSARFSPDGRFIATMTEDAKARIWDGATGEPLSEALPPDEPVRHAGDGGGLLVFSPDSEMLVTVSWSHAQVWNVATGELLFPPLVHGGIISDVEFSPDGELIATSGERKVKLWSVASAKLQHTLDLGDGDGAMARFSPDGRRVVGSGGFHVRVWDVTSGERLLVLDHDAGVSSAYFSPDGVRLVTADANRAVRMFDAQNGRLLFPPILHGAVVIDVRFDPTGERLLSREPRRLRVWDSRTGRPLSEWILHRKDIKTAQFSPDGRNVLASDDTIATLWDIRPGQALNLALRIKALVPSARFSRDGTRVVTGSGGIIYSWWQDGPPQAAVWDARTGELISAPITAWDAVQFAEFSPDGRKIVTAAGYEARVWDAQTGVPVSDAMRHGGYVPSARFSPDGRKVVTTCEDKTARIWDAETGRPLTDPINHAGQVGAAEFSPDGRSILTVSHDDAARLWDAETGRARLPGSFGKQKSAACFSPDGQLIVVGGSDGSAEIWDIGTGKPVGEPLKHQGAIRSVRFSPDGRYIVTASEDQSARIWDARSGRPVTEPLLHKGPVLSAEFSRDSRRVVTASTEYSARVWDVATGRPLTDSLREGHWVGYAEFSPDGTHLVTATGNALARIWELPPARLPFPKLLPELAEAIAGQSWTDEEVSELVPAARYFACRAEVLKTTDTDDQSRWMKWLLADRGDRTTSYGSPVTAAMYLSRLIENMEHGGRPGEALHLSPDNAVATVCLARHFVTRRDRYDVKEIEFLCQRALKLNPQDPQVWRVHAEILEKTGRPEEALTAIERAIGLEAGHAESWIAKGRLLEQARRADEALQTYSKAIALAGASTNSSPQRATTLKAGLLARANLLLQSGHLSDSAKDNLQARGIPPRSLRAAPGLVDLSCFYNVSFTNDWLDGQWGHANLACVPTGIHTLAGVQFDVRGAIGVGSHSGVALPIRVDGLAVNRRCRNLQFLHSAVIINWPSWSEVQIGAYTVRYEDGGRQSIPIVMGKTIGRWLDGRHGAEVAWAGANDGTFRDGRRRLLYKMTWLNPRPEVAIQTVDMEWGKTNSEAMQIWGEIRLVAITAQEEPTPSITIQPQPRTVVEGADITLHVQARSELPLVYQWQFNGGNLPGATNSSLSLTSVSREHAGAYTVELRNAIENSLLTLTSQSAPLVVSAGGVSYGLLRREVFNDISGNNLSDLTNHTGFPNNPDTADFAHEFETPTSFVEDYGVRLSGYLLPPKTGDYRFYLCSDDQGALFLSPDEAAEHKRQIAHEPHSNQDRLWIVPHGRLRQENISSPIHLEAGRRYYIEALMKQGKGYDYLGVTWQMPGDPPPEDLAPPIPGTFLAVPTGWASSLSGAPDKKIVEQ